MTHKAAVQRMANWLRNNQRCGVVMAELVTMNHETPDVLGFHDLGDSILVECKVSRADFLADRQKIFRRVEDMGMGDHRYFAAPAGMLTADDLPAGWGLLEIVQHHVRVRQQPELKEANKRAEVKMLMSAIRRLEISTAVFVRTCEEGELVRDMTLET